MHLLIPALFKIALIKQLTLSFLPSQPSYVLDPHNQLIYYALDNTIWKMNYDGSKKQKLIKGRWPALNDQGDELAFLQGDQLYTLSIPSKETRFVSPAASFPRYHQGTLYYLARSGFFFHLWIFEEGFPGTGTPLTDLESTTSVLYYNFAPSGQIYFTTAPYDLVEERVIKEQAATHIYGEQDSLFLPEGEGGVIAPSWKGADFAYVSRILSSPCLYLHYGGEDRDELVTCSEPFDSIQNTAYSLFAFEPAFLPDGKLLWTIKKNGRYLLALFSHDGSLIAFLHRSATPIFFLRAHPGNEGVFFLQESIFGGTKKVALYYAGFIKVWVNEQPVDFGSAYPVIQDNTLLVPIKVLAPYLGFQWEWDNKAKKTIGLHPSAFVEIFPREGRIIINGEARMAQLPIIDGRQHMPLSLLVEAIGATMEWKPNQFLAEVVWHRAE